MRLFLPQCHGGVGVSTTSEFTSVNSEGNTMKKQDIIREYRSGAGESFRKAGAYDLQGWCQVYELYLDSGLDTVQFGTTLEDAGLNKLATVKQNLSHIKWAIAFLSETLEDDATIEDVVSEFTGVNQIRNARYEKKDNQKKKAPAKVASTKPKTEAQVRKALIAEGFSKAEATLAMRLCGVIK